MGQDMCTRVTEQSHPKLTIYFQNNSEKHEEVMDITATIELVATRIQAQIEDEMMKTVVPAMVEAMSSKFETFVASLVPLKVDEMRQQVNHSPCSRSLPHDNVNSSVSKSLELSFLGTLPDTLLTFNNIQDQGAALMMELLDSSGSRVDCGREASIKIKIFVLHGDFEVDDTDDWTKQEFDKNVALPRKDKGPLLKGMTEIYMSNGVASVSDIAFTDNSKCMRNGKFRLGARAIKGLPPGVEIRDAVSGAFRVKERRVKSYRKHKSPSLEDSTHCLKNVGHTLHSKLVANGIHMVKDFLRLYHSDPNRLQNIIQIAENKWSELIENAKLCTLSNEHYRYCDEASGIALLLDCVFNIVKVKFNDEVSFCYEDLDDSQKELVNKLRFAAYEKRKELRKICVPINPTTMQAKSQSTVPNSTTHHLDTTSEDTALRMSNVNPLVNSTLKVPDLGRIVPNQTDQGEEGLLPDQIPPNGVLELLLPLMPSKPGIPTEQSLNLTSQQHSFEPSPNSTSFEGAEAIRLGPLSDSQVSFRGLNSEEDPISLCSKRIRLG